MAAKALSAMITYEVFLPARKGWKCLIVTDAWETKERDPNTVAECAGLFRPTKLKTRFRREKTLHATDDDHLAWRLSANILERWIASVTVARQ